MGTMSTSTLCAKARRLHRHGTMAIRLSWTGTFLTILQATVDGMGAELHMWMSVQKALPQKLYSEESPYIGEWVTGRWRAPFSC